jgi:hypothetical protein
MLVVCLKAVICFVRGSWFYLANYVGCSIRPSGSFLSKKWAPLNNGQSHESLFILGMREGGGEGVS